MVAFSAVRGVTCTHLGKRIVCSQRIQDVTADKLPFGDVGYMYMHAHTYTCQYGADELRIVHLSSSTCWIASMHIMFPFI